jgi:ATP-dependent DNA helicase RecQ
LDGLVKAGASLRLFIKDVETYGIVKITAKGLDFINDPSSFMMSEDHEYNEI